MFVCAWPEVCQADILSSVAYLFADCSTLYTRPLCVCVCVWECDTLYIYSPRVCARVPCSRAPYSRFRVCQCGSALRVRNPLRAYSDSGCRRRLCCVSVSIGINIAPQPPPHPQQPQQHPKRMPTIDTTQHHLARQCCQGMKFSI